MTERYEHLSGRSLGAGECVQGLALRSDDRKRKDRIG